MVGVYRKYREFHFRFAEYDSKVRGRTRRGTDVRPKGKEHERETVRC